MKNNTTIMNTDKFQNLLSKVYKIDRISEIIKHGEKGIVIILFSDSAPFTQKALTIECFSPCLIISEILSIL